MIDDRDTIEDGIFRTVIDDKTPLSSLVRDGMTAEEAQRWASDVLEENETSVPDLVSCDGCSDEFPEADLFEGLCADCQEEAELQDARQAEIVSDYKAGLL